MSIINSKKKDRQTGDQIKETSKKQSFWEFLKNEQKNGRFRILQNGPGGWIDLRRRYREEKAKIESKYDTYETILEAGTERFEYYILLVLSCLIATFGLLQNSPATIIGAMIVAPLMGPIVAFSASMLIGRTTDIFGSLTALLKGIVIVLVITSVLAFLIPGGKVTAEILARTRPSLYDIAVAVLCGLIGSYGQVNKKLSSSMTGVAISVALMPPLCTVGIGLGLLDLRIAFGALTLFACNFLGISLASLVVFYLVRLHPDDSEAANVKRRALMHGAVTFVLILFVSAGLFYFTWQGYNNQVMRDKIRTEVTQKLGFSGSIYQMSSIQTGNAMAFQIIVLETQPILAELRNRIEEETAQLFPGRITVEIFYIDKGY